MSKSAIDRHGNSAAHLRAVRTLENQPKICTEQQPKQDYLLLTQVKVAAFLSENNLPFSLSPALTELIKSIQPSTQEEARALKNMKLGATKCTNIVRQSLGLYFCKDLVDLLKNTKFSVIPNETTDVSCTKQLAMCVVYFDYNKFETITSFFDAVEVTQCDAKSLYSAIKSSFESRSIPMSNIIGFSSDTCNVMFGERPSVMSLIREECNNIVFVKCSFHMIHLCVSHACVKLSTTLEDLCRNIFNYFSRSSLRQHELKKFQMFFQISSHKMLSFGQTRWLSLEQCVSRMLEQWGALTLYFSSIVAEKRDPSYVTDSILQNLKNPFIKAQMEFLQVQSHRTNEFNTLFQSDQPLLHALHEKVCQLLKELMSDFVKLDVIRNCDVLTLNVHSKLVQV